jgi:hypothetical protein
VTLFPFLCPHCDARLSVRKDAIAAIQARSITCKTCNKSFSLTQVAELTVPATPTPAGERATGQAPTQTPREPLYRYKCNGKASEPVRVSELQRLALSGLLQPYDHVSREDQADWFLASSVVSFAASGEPPPPPPSARPRKAAKGNWAITVPRPVQAIQGFLYFSLSVAIACYLAWYALTAYSLFHFNSILGGQDASSVTAIEQQAHWLDWYLPRVPSLLRASKNAVTKQAGSANGRWNYEIKTKGGKSHAFVQSEELNNRTESSLGRQWLALMASLGHTRTNWYERPTAVRIEEFIIREPGGNTWVICDPTEGSSDAFRLFTLAVMLGTTRYKGDVRFLADYERGSFGYAFSFAAVSSAFTFDEAIQMSCEKNTRRRIFAAEILMSTIPTPRTDSPSPSDKLKQLEKALNELAEEIDIADKHTLYKRLRAQLSSDEPPLPSAP